MSVQVPVSVPGVQGGTIDLQFATQQNAQLAGQLLDQIYAAARAARLTVQNAPTAPFLVPGELGLFTLGDAGGVMNQGPNAATVPTGYVGIVDAFEHMSATITGAANQFNETVFSGQGGLTFYLNGGSGTVIAGGGNNVIAPGAGAPVTGGSWSILLDGGNNTVVGTAGNFFIDDGSGGAAGSNLIFLGSGNETVQSWGSDIIVAAPGGNAVVATFGRGTVFYGSNGASEIFNQGADDIFVQGGGQETVFAQATGGLYFGNAGALTFLSAPGTDSTVVAGQGAAALYGAPNTHGVFFVGPGQFMLDGGSGNQTVVGTAGFSASAVMFSENGGSLTLFGNTDNNLLVAGAGNATLNAGGTSGNDAFFAGTGNDSIVASSGTNFIAGGPGSDTLIGGSGANLFDVNHAFAAGGNELIANWNTTDQLYLFGYGAATGNGGLPSGTTVAVVNGSEVMTLSDGTRITFLGVSSASTAQIQTG